MTKGYSLEELKKMKSKTDVDQFKKTSEKDIREQSMADLDTPYLTDKELKEFSLPKNRKNSDAKKQ